MKRLATTLTAATIALFLSSNAQALTINDPGVVGILEGMVQGDNGSSVANELIIANQILALAGINQTVEAAAPPGIECGNGANDQSPCEYRNGDNDYIGALTGGVQSAKGDTTVGEAGAVWVLAKYDGQNAGYVLFNLTDFGTTTLPEIPWEIWGNNNDKGFALSHYTVFSQLNTCAEDDPDCNVTFVPDGGSTLALLGSALVAISAVSRRFRRN